MRLAISARLCPGRRAERFPDKIYWQKSPPASPPRRLFPGFAHVCPSDSGSGRGGSVGSSVGFIYNYRNEFALVVISPRSARIDAPHTPARAPPYARSVPTYRRFEPFPRHFFARLSPAPPSTKHAHQPPHHPEKQQPRPDVPTIQHPRDPRKHKQPPEPQVDRPPRPLPVRKQLVQRPKRQPIHVLGRVPRTCDVFVVRCDVCCNV